ncbi:MAG: hypothetical protein QOI26_1209 [Pseudonocardiales bacterium]|nr:hypothetical protein [Pseudonocardiales bacterium]
MTSVSSGSAEARQFVNLNGVRALAALSVLATHVGFNTGRSVRHSWYGPFLARLDFGVTLFFLLSGFLLYRPFLIYALASGAPGDDAGPSWRRFLWRRALRILPAYWVVVVVTLGVLTTKHYGLQTWLSNLSLTQTISGGRLDPSLTQMWTLSVELSFYAVLPLIAWLAKAAGRRLDRPVAAQLAVLGLLAAVPYAFQVLTRSTSGLGLRALLWTPCYLDWFAAGMFLALVSVLSEQGPERHWILRTRTAAADWRACLSLGVLLWWLTTLPLGGPLDLNPATSWQWAMRHALYLGAAFFLLLPVTVTGSRRPSPILASSPAWLLGEVSYGIYLWHLPIVILTYRVFHIQPFHGNFWSILLAVAVSATAIAALSWCALERPLIRRLARRPTDSVSVGPNANTRDTTMATRQPS